MPSDHRLKAGKPGDDFGADGKKSASSSCRDDEDGSGQSMQIDTESPLFGQDVDGVVMGD